MSNDLIRELGALAFASRLRRLSERLMHDASTMYADRGSEFEARWFPVAYLLGQRAAMGITEIAGKLGYTHPAVVQIAAAMERRGLVKSRADAQDGRRRLLSLTPHGKRTVQQLAPVWEAVRTCTEDVLAGTGHDVLGVLDALERELDRQELLPRVRRRLRHGDCDIEVIPFSRTIAPHFARLNREWLGKDVPIEPHDARVLDDPAKEVIAKGGHILFARDGREIVATAAIVPHAAGAYEITKMAVTPRRRGEGIGRLLADRAIAWARGKNAARILIATSPKLTRALSLYRSLGFKEITPDRAWKQQYNRRTIFMELRNAGTHTDTAKE